MNHPEKQLKYSIRKVSVGAASVVIGALYLLMGAGIAHAEGVESARETERTANPTDPEQSGNGKTGNKPDLSNTDAAANTYNAPVAENPLVAPEAAKPRRTKRALPDGDASNSSNGDAGTASGENQPTGENSPVLDANRKGETVKTDQPGVHVPKDGEEGSDDKNAHLTFDTPGENATVEYMYKIIQNMPDDFQNNERSYLRNMNTLGDALRFDENGNVTKDESGKQLQDGEIREINEFGGWKAINGGTFAIGKKNAQGYFTGWYYKKGSTTEKEQGGMLGSDAMDRVYLHEQALDRRFNYMLMLAKGRTIANKTDKAQDESNFEIKTEKRTGNTLDKLPVKEKEDILQHSPNIDGFNGIEKTFTAFSTKYGSRLKIDFVTGYISDYEGSKGTYRIVVKAIKKDKNDTSKEVEETIYDHTINRIDGVVENEERYSQGVDLSEFNKVIKNLLKEKHEKKVRSLAEARYKEQHPEVTKTKLKDYKDLMPIITKELAEKDKGAVTYELPIDKDKLQIQGTNSFKEGIPFAESYAAVANKLNNSLSKTLNPEVRTNSPIWLVSNEQNSDGTIKNKDSDRVYKILDFVLPTAKKIIYHADTDQLELQTDPEKVKSHRQELEARLKTKKASLASSTDEEEITKLNKEISALKAAIGSTNAYTYLEARNGSKEAKILGSHMEATEQPEDLTEADYNRIRTNDLAAKEKDGLPKFTHYFVEKDKVARSEVISDEELSKKIHAEIGGDEDKLGKGGYFSTGDIPLDKDVVAYKIQVFAENKKRVGVNKQSPRLQYNLPILADFSVIQDTVEPSKEVAKRIIDKQIKENKIPKEEGEKLKGKIDESKKTSEVRKAISGNVKVKYVDEQGRDIPLSDEEAKKVGEKSDNGTYLVEKEALIGSSYDVTSKKLRGINAGEKKYRLKRSLDNTDGLYTNSAAVTGSVTSTDKIVTFVYEEGEPAKAKAVVRVMKQQEAGDPVELVDHKLNLETEVGEEFPSESVNNKVKELQKLGYEIIGNTFTNGTAESRKGDTKEDLDGQEPTQSYTITVQEKTVEVTEPKNPNDPVDPEKPDGFKFEKAIEETNLKKDVTRTIKYLIKATPTSEEIESGKASVIQTVHFKRKAIYNLVTKTVTYENWTTDNKNFSEVVTPELEGYTPDRESVSQSSAETPAQDGTVKNITEKVIYTPKEQKLLVKVFNTTTGKEVELKDKKIELTGKTNELVDTSSVETAIKKFKERGYVVQDNPIPKGLKYDTKDDLDNEEPTQVYKLFIKEPISIDTDSKTVTRTITYVKKDLVDGVEVPSEAHETVTDRATFNREVKFNLVTGETTYGKWSEAQTLNKVASPVLSGYIADRAEVGEREVTATTEDIQEEVVYTKIGTWVPNLPSGETPIDPIPYPNHPTDPTKPGDPIPGVIPYVPGYTPKVGDKPLVPKNPKDLTEGYTPPTPTDPKSNTAVTYEPDSQKALVKVVNTTTGVEVRLPAEDVNLEGKTAEKISTEKVLAKIADLEKRGFVVDNKDEVVAEITKSSFDKQKDEEGKDPSQVFTLKVHEKVVTITEPPTPNTPIDPDTPDDPNDPSIPKWTEELVNQLSLKKDVTRTITYVKKDTPNGEEIPNAKPTVTQTAHFKRTVKVNVATRKVVEYTDWTSMDNNLAEVRTEKLDGYVADKLSVASVTVAETSNNLVEKVIYTKLGAWIPKIPKGVVPPEGTDTNPKPYPNHPTDPTKPGNPTDPNVPVIPYIPGYTPKIGETPLQPKVPGDPTKGYIPPSIPTEPGTDKEISYVPDSQRALVKVYNVKDGVKIPLENDTVGINDGKTDQAIPTKSLEDKIKELEKRGYTVDNKDLLKGKVFDNQKDPENGDPTQVYDLLVRERISFDTETKAVTRTIKYVKIEEQNGAEVEVENAQPTNTQTVNFSRDISINLATGRISNGKWSEKQILGEVKTPVLEGYLADKAKVESREVTGDSESFEEKVVYRKIGSWVPKVPGKEEPTPIPYPNDPDDPTKPKTPDYPTTPPQPGQPVPKVPVIPYVPGYTPKTPNGTPLVPIDPEHPEKGYKVPPVPETPNDPKMDTPIKYTPDGQRAIVKFVVIGEDGKETELVASRMSLTGKTGEKIPTENFNDTLKKLTGDPVNNGDYELVDNPLKDGATFDNVKDEEGKDPSQVFVVKLRQIYVIPPTPRIVERPSGNTVEVDVPNKDADTLSITFTKRNSTEKETIVTKKDKDGTWKIEKSPVGVTINPTNGRVYIPSEQVQPKTWVDTQTKHKYKQSKIVSVMPNILDVPKFEGTTEWIDVNGNVLRPTENGLHEKGRIANHVWLESRLEGNKVTHIFFAGSPSVDKPEYKITVWFDKDGNPLKPDQPGTHEAGNIPGYRYITTVTKDGITIHRFEKIPPVLPNEPNPDRPEEPRPQPNPEHPSAPTPNPELPNQETPIPEPTPEPETSVSPDPEVPTYETGKREELPNTGTEANAGLAGAGLLTLLAGLGLGFFKKKEDESE